MSDKQEEDLKKLRNFMIKIQLDNYSKKLEEDLHILKIDHLEYVEIDDLIRIGMSLPDTRRLFDHYKSYRKSSLSAVNRVKKALGLVNQSSVLVSKESAMRGVTDTNKCIISENDIVLNESLGKGAFGVVHKAEWKCGKETVNVAVKSLQVGSEIDLPQLVHDLMMEAKTMMTLRHPNLIELYGITVTPPMKLVTEFAPLGSLISCLISEPHKFLISTLASFLVQIVAGMKYLEEKRYVHRDLAARNCLLMTYEKVKIGDFGLSRPLRIDDEWYVMQPEARIPTAWSAPECIEYKKFSHASDIWAFGVTAFEIFSFGAQPWPCHNASEIFEKISEPNNERLPRPQNCPKILYDIMKNICWANKPEDRGSFKRLERHMIDCLPHELKATFSNAHGEPSDDLQFIDGDLITAFDFSNGISWKCQNRRTQQIGFVSKQSVNLKSSVIENSSEESKYRRRYASEGDMQARNRPQEAFAERKSFDGKLEKKFFGLRKFSRTIEQDSSGSGYESTDSSSIDKRKNSGNYNCSLSSTDSGYRCSSQYSTDSIYTEIDSTYSEPVNIPRRPKQNSFYINPSPLSASSFNASLLSSSPIEDFSQQIYSSPSSLPSYPAAPPSIPSNQSDSLLSTNNWRIIPDTNNSTKQYVQMSSPENIENKSPLPDIVNPRKKASHFSRRRSLPRLRNKLSSRLDEKRYSLTPSPQSTLSRSIVSEGVDISNFRSPSRPKSVPNFSQIHEIDCQSSLYEVPSNSQWYDEIPSTLSRISINNKAITEDVSVTKTCGQIEDDYQQVYEALDDIIDSQTTSNIIRQSNDSEFDKEKDKIENVVTEDSSIKKSDLTHLDIKKEKLTFILSDDDIPSPRYENVIHEGSLFDEINAELNLSNIPSIAPTNSKEREENEKDGEQAGTNIS